jgi:HlyD family secretion protein
VVVAAGYRALLVPAASIATFAGIDRVFTVHEGKAAEKRIKTGRRSNEGVEIVEGIRPGDRVVLNPGNMADGEKIILKD